MWFYSVRGKSLFSTPGSTFNEKLSVPELSVNLFECFQRFSSILLKQKYFVCIVIKLDFLNATENKTASH